MFRTKEHNEKISEANKGKKKNYVVGSVGRKWMHPKGSTKRKDCVFIKPDEVEKYLELGYVFGMKDNPTV